MDIHDLYTCQNLFLCFLFFYSFSCVKGGSVESPSKRKGISALGCVCFCRYDTILNSHILHGIHGTAHLPGYPHMLLVGLGYHDNSWLW